MVRPDAELAKVGLNSVAFQACTVAMPRRSKEKEEDREADMRGAPEGCRGGASMCEAGPLPWRLRCPFVADVAAAPPSWQFRPAIQQADLAPPGAASGTLIWAGCRPRRRIPASPLPGTWGPPPPAPAHRVVGTAGGQPVKVGRDAGGGRRQRQAEGAKGVTAAYARRRQNSQGSEPGVRPALFWVRQKHMYKAASYLPIPRSCKAPAATRSAAAPVPLHLAGWLSSAPTSSPPASTNL